MMAAAPVSLSAAWPLSQLLQHLAPVPSALEVSISGLATDSRRVRPGDLFLACSGQQGRGHDYIPAAIAAGAAAIVYDEDGADALHDLHKRYLHVPMIGVAQLSRRVGEIAARFYGEPSQHMHVTGVTGGTSLGTLKRGGILQL